MVEACLQIYVHLQGLIYIKNKCRVFLTPKTQQIQGEHLMN